jgi:hypothetical protein
MHLASLRVKNLTTMSALTFSEAPEPSRLQNIAQLLFPSTVRVQDVETLHGHTHSLRLLRLSNGLQLVLKSSPRSSTSLLRRELRALETEARALALLRRCANPCIPQLFHYDPHGGFMGSAFLLRQHMKGSTVLEMEPSLTPGDRKEVDRHLVFLARIIGQQVAPSFGSLEEVAAGRGSHSWRRAFTTLFEDALRDAEDMFIHLPYAEIRREVNRLSPVLEEITTPRLVIIHLGRPSQVLLDPELKQLSGIVDLASAFWGDILMAEIFEAPPFAVLDSLDSYGLRLTNGQTENIRLLL